MEIFATYLLSRNNNTSQTKDSYKGGKHSDLDIFPPPPTALLDMIQDSCTPTPLCKGKWGRGTPPTTTTTKP